MKSPHHSTETPSALFISKLGLATLFILFLASCGGVTTPPGMVDTPTSGTSSSAINVPASSANNSATSSLSNASFTPLYSADTPKQPALKTLNNGFAYTYFGERVRERHAREDGEAFMRYRRFPRFYFEKRTFEMEIIDKTPAGEGEVVFNVTTDHPFEGDAVFTLRIFFSGRNTVADYFAGVLFTTVTDEYNDGRYHYRYTLREPLVANSPVSVEAGSPMEFEITINLNRTDGVGEDRGDANYYSRTWLLMLGTPGTVAWDATGGYPVVDGLAQASAPLPASALSGGDTTLSADLSGEPMRSFQQMAQNIAPQHAQPFVEGRRLFHSSFITGEHSEQGNGTFEDIQNLAGPNLIAPSCVSCHVNNGRSLPPTLGPISQQLVVKVAEEDANGNPAAHSTYGTTLQTQSLTGQAEATISLSDFTHIEGTYADGTAYRLRKPQFTFNSGQPITQFSARTAPQLVGMGLLEAIDETTLAQQADPTDTNGDGISGRLSLVKGIADGTPRVGRFGWKAERASLEEQVANALSIDMGVSSTLLPDSQGMAEVDDKTLSKITTFLRTLGVPPRRDVSHSDVVAGATIFNAIGCTHCHLPTLQTGDNHPFAELRNQTIYPYTDLLLHDMGDGLASNLNTANAQGREWRTKPLWGLGLTAAVGNGEASYLHDGRASTLSEAILWHGGEALAPRQAFTQINLEQRNQLIAFLNSL